MRKEGNLIKDVLWAKGWTIKDMAESMGISNNAFTQKLAGDRGFKIKEINFICDKLNMTYEELFKNNDKIKTS